MWWLVALLAIVGGVIGFLVSRAAPTTYRADASIVINSRTTIPVDNIAPVLETLFATDPVIQSVVDEVGLEETPGQLLSEGVLAASASPGGSMNIQARAQSPELAVDIANSAARSFSTLAATKEIADFAIYPALDASRSAGVSPRLFALAGAALGILLGVVLILTGFFVNQPVLTAQEASEVLGADIAVTIRAGVSSVFKRKKKARVVMAPAGIAPKVVEASRHDVEGPLRCVVVESGGGLPLLRAPGRAWRAVLRRILTEIDAKPHLPSSGSETRKETTRRTRRIPTSWISSGDQALPEALEEAGSVIVLVPEGARRPALEELGEELLVCADYGYRAVLFVKFRRSLLQV